MPLFNLGKKKETPCCCGAEEQSAACREKPSAVAGGQSARFIVLGACCQKSTETYSNVKQAVKDLGFTDDVVNIGDDIEIAKYGVMQTPALVVDGKVVSHGKLLKVDDIKKIFEKLGVKQK